MKIVVHETNESIETMVKKGGKFSSNKIFIIIYHCMMKIQRYTIHLRYVKDKNRIQRKYWGIKVVGKFKDKETVQATWTRVILKEPIDENLKNCS